MSVTWQGYYLDGRSAARQRASVAITDSRLEISLGNGVIKAWPYGEIHQTQGSYDGEPVRLEFGREPIEALVITTPAFLTEVHRIAPNLGRRLHNPATRRARMKWTVVAAFAVVVMTIGLYRWGIPGFASLMTPLIPISWEDRFGAEVVQHFLPEEQRCTDPERLLALTTVTDTLMRTVPNSPYRIRLYVMNSPAINAFAAPGGHIVVLKGLLERTQTAEQLAGVLAHELQHVLKRHTTRTILEQTASSALLAAIAGDFSGGLVWGLEGARTLGTLHYSRTHETEADTEGLRMMQAAGLDAGQMIAFYGVMQRADRETSNALAFLSSHPDMGERMTTLLSMAGWTPHHPTRLLPDRDWKDIRSLCRLKTQESRPAS